MTLLVLGAAEARAQAEDRPMRDSAPLTKTPEWRSFAVPALESLAMNFSLLAFSNLVTQEPFARLTGQTTLDHLRPTSWTFDVDYYLTNQFGHPYQGALTFNAARSSGLSFWWSTLYAALGSLVWELFFEAEPPSVNDQLTTPLGGALLGEALHRCALQLRGADGPAWLRILGAALLDPLGALNGTLLEPPTVQDVTLDPLLLDWSFGVTAGVVANAANAQPTIEARDRLQALVAVHLISGPPWDARSTYDTPLSYFDLYAELSFPRKVVGDIFIRGLLQGSRFQAPHLTGVWGLYGLYDYAAPTIMRASGVGLGPGVTLLSNPSSWLYLQLSAHVGASPFLAVGQLLDVSPDLGRDYHVGPGLQSLVDLKVMRPGVFEVELTARNWFVAGVYTDQPGVESMTHVRLSSMLTVWKWVGVGAAVTVSDRRAVFQGTGDKHDTGLALRLTVDLLSDPLSGVRP